MYSLFTAYSCPSVCLRSHHAAIASWQRRYIHLHPNQLLTGTVNIRSRQSHIIVYIQTSLQDEIALADTRNLRYQILQHHHGEQHGKRLLP